MNEKISDEILKQITSRYGEATADIIKDYTRFRSIADRLKKTIELIGGYARGNILFVVRLKSQKKSLKMNDPLKNARPFGEAAESIIKSGFNFKNVRELKGGVDKRNHFL